MHVSRAHASGLFFFTLCWLAYDHYRPWVNFHSEMLAFAGLFCLVTGVLTYRRKLLELPRASVWVALTALVPWLQYATGISLFAGDALVSSLYVSGLLAAIFVGYSLCQSDAGHQERGVMGLMHCLWIASMASAAIGLAQWLNVQGPLAMYVVQSDLGDRAMGNLGQANQLATLLLMGIVAYTLVYERKVIGGLVLSIGIGFLTIVLVLTQSRAGMLSVLILAAFMIWKTGAVRSRVSPKAVICWVLSFFIGIFLLPYLSETLLLAPVRSLAAVGPVSERWQMWQQVAYAILQSPWVGYGWNQTPTAHAAGAIAFPGSVTYTNAHNFVMDMLAWNGLPLGLLLTGAIAYWFVTRAFSTRRIDAIYAMACLLPIAVHSMLEYPFAYAYFLIASGFMVGVVEAAALPAKTVKFDNRWAWAFLGLWVSVSSYLTYEYFLIEEDFRVVRFENLRIGVTPTEYEVPHVWMASHMAAMLKAGRQIAKPNMLAADIENLRRASERFAYGAVRFRYAQALALNGNPKEASHQMAIIRGMYGEFYYAASKEELRRLQTEKYPQLANIVLPE